MAWPAGDSEHREITHQRAALIHLDSLPLARTAGFSAGRSMTPGRVFGTGRGFDFRGLFLTPGSFLKSPVTIHQKPQPKAAPERSEGLALGERRRRDAA